MFGVLEKNDRKPTKEEAEKFINELFDISSAASEALILFRPVGVEDYEFLIFTLKTLKKCCKELINNSQNLTLNL